MADRVLLALTSSPEGGPACLLRHGGLSIVSRLVAQLAEDGEVAVVTWAAWEDAVRAAVPDAVVVHGVLGPADALRAVTAAGDGELVLAHAHLVANDLALGRVADQAARGTGAVVWPVAAVGGRPGSSGPARSRGKTDGTPVRVTRGRIVAAGSGYHAVEHPNGVCMRTLRVGAGDRARAVVHLEELAALLDGGPPEEWHDALDRTDRRGGEHGSEGKGGGHGGGSRPGVDPEDDLVGLALVALVRGGLTVGAIGVPAGSVWRHPRTASEVADALASVEEVDEERQRLDAAVKADDGFFTTFFVSSYSRYWARWAARRGFTPNQVTTVSMLVGIGAALAFAVGDPLWALLGAVLLQLAFTLDCVDGQLARYSRRFSALGAWLDSVFDRGKEYVVYAGLAVGGIRAGDDAGLWLLAGAALALQTFRHSLDFGYAEQQLADIDAAVSQPLTPVAEQGPSFWEATPAPAVGPGPTRARAAASAPVAASLPRRIIGLLRRAEGVGVLRWAKRIVVLPIGERFALISVVAVLAGPRAVFLALLVWGGLATAYTAGGRIVRSIA